MRTPEGELYRSVRLRIDDLVRGADESTCTTPVPACPGWTVHDVVAHVTGVADDVLHGRTAGLATDPWTAAQVATRAGVPTDDVLDEWARLAESFEAMTLPPPAIIDVTTHEQDLRGALGRPGERDSEAMATVMPMVAEFVARAAADASGRVVVVRSGDEQVEVGDGADANVDGGGPLVLTTDPFELVRAGMGRRSAAQIAALGWSEDVSVFADRLSVFGPRTSDLIEPGG